MLYRCGTRSLVAWWFGSFIAYYLINIITPTVIQFLWGVSHNWTAELAWFHCPWRPMRTFKSASRSEKGQRTIKINGMQLAQQRSSYTYDLFFHTTIQSKCHSCKWQCLIKISEQNVWRHGLLLIANWSALQQHAAKLKIKIYKGNVCTFLVIQYVTIQIFLFYLFILFFKYFI